MKKDKIPTIILAAVLAVAVILLWNRPQPPGDSEVTEATPYEAKSRFSTIKSKREVIVHCGNSMRLAMEEIAGEFQRQTGIAVVFNFGGGSELLPLIEMGRRGDLFLCHDPYENLIDEKGLLVDSIVVGMLKPVILVPKGNPKGIAGLSDLGREGLRVATVDPRYATAGKMVYAALESNPWGESVRRNIVIETRSHGDSAVSLVTGHIDAAVVWNFLAALYSADVDSIDAGVEFNQQVRVTLCRLKSSENTEEATELMKFAQGDFAKEVWTRYGYQAPQKD